MSISIAGTADELHAVIVFNGSVRHRVREPDGDWGSWDMITAPEGIEFTEVTCASVGCTLHILMKDSHGLYWHDIRRSDGHWQGAAQLPDQPVSNG